MEPPPGPRTPTTLDQLAPDVRASILQANGTNASIHQKIVFALLERTFVHYEKVRSGGDLADITSSLVMAICGAIAAFVGLAIADAGFSFLPAAVADAGLYGLAVAAVVFLLRNHYRALPHAIQFGNNRPISRFAIGRLESAMSKRIRTNTFFGVLFGLQCGLLFFAKQYPVLGESVTFEESLRLTTDNLLYGVLFDACELYGIGYADRPLHGFWSGALFLLFRYSMLGFFVYAAYTFWRGATIHSYFAGLADHRRDYDALAGHLTVANRTRRIRLARFGDEAVFLVICEAFLHGKTKAVEHWGTRFPYLAISPDVKALFVGPDGTKLLAREPLRA